ncbi:MAG: PfkB family carbohydrate kinase, partial [Armatimonadota bacterium]
TGKPVFLTASVRGMLVFHDRAFDEVHGVKIDGPIDPTGAGDSATSGAVLALASGASLVEAALIANLVASITVCQIDTTGTAKSGDLPGRLKLWQSMHN